jgi:uncharacterized protein YutE (UPF0331/DUF86 family)
MVDPLRLRALLERLRGVEGELERLRRVGRDPVRQDPDRLNSVKYLFVLAAEIAIDAGQHVVASEGLDAPTTFAGVFAELGRSGWVPEDLAAPLGSLARFRNLLVHGYADVDDDRVVAILHSAALGDLAAFRKELARRALQEPAPGS